MLPSPRVALTPPAWTSGVNVENRQLIAYVLIAALFLAAIGMALLAVRKRKLERANRRGHGDYSKPRRRAP